MTRIIALAAFAFLFTAMLTGTANAEVYGYGQTYSEAPDGGHTLRLPQGYQQTTTVTRSSGYVTADRASVEPLTVEPARMLPQSAQVVAVAPVAVPVYAAPSYSGTTTVTTNTTATYGAMVQNDRAVNVQMRAPCESDTNHRARNKGINTSTTVGNSCLD